MKATRHDGRSRWKCPITDRFFDNEAEQAEFTESVIEQQGEGLTLAERRELFNQNSVVSPTTL